MWAAMWIGSVRSRCCNVLINTRLPVVPFISFMGKPGLTTTTMEDGIKAGKKAAAIQAVENHVKDNQIIGIGSGSTIIYAIDRLVEKVKNENLKIICVPTSFQAKQEILEKGLTLGHLETYPQLDIAIDGADEVDANLNCIKGGGGCLTQEKIVDYCAKDLIIVADERKDSVCLGDNWTHGVPIEIIPMSFRPVQIKIEQCLGGKAVLRQATKKAGPVVTDNGNFIIDWIFEGKHDWEKVDTFLHSIPGVLETGLFIQTVKYVYFGKADGKVTVRKSSREINNYH